MPYGWPHFGYIAPTRPEPPPVGRPHRDRAKVKAGRKAARRNR